MDLFTDMFIYCDPAKLYFGMAMLIAIFMSLMGIFVKKLPAEDMTVKLLQQTTFILICSFIISYFCKNNMMMMALLWGAGMTLCTLASTVGIKQVI